MRRARIQIAKPDIASYFDNYPKKVLKLADIATILTEERDGWRLARTTTTQEFIKFLTQNSNLKKLDLPFPYRKERRYVWGEVPIWEVLLTIKRDAYYTHYTAVRMHGLTEQLPKTIYVNHEQRPHTPNPDLAQDRIDTAFRNSPRSSNNVITLGEYRVCLINGMHTNQLGVVTDTFKYDVGEPAHIRVTNIERTLIDIAVRPTYAGGPSEVLKAYGLARDRFSVNKLAAMLKQLSYVYPYHQAIGFYLERAGYSASSLQLLRQFPMDFNFYLHHKMGQAEYIKDWKLFVPKGF